MSQEVVVRWITHAQCRGQSFRPGQQSQLDEVTARVYEASQQCEILRPAAKSGEPKKPRRATRKTIKRGGQPAETAATDAGEKR